MVLENSCRADEHDCPFALASIELTNMLCDILKVGEQREFAELMNNVRYYVQNILPPWHVTFIYSNRWRTDVLPHVLHPGQAIWGVLLCVHSAAKQDLERDEGYGCRLPEGMISHLCLHYIPQDANHQICWLNADPKQHLTWVPKIRT